MRVTHSSFYRNFQEDRKHVSEMLKDTNAQIASGKQIKYGHQNPIAFADTMRLDNEIQGLEQVGTISQRAKKFSDYTDNTLKQLTEGLERFKSKILYASNGSHSPSSIQALAREMGSIKEHLFNLANTSVDGKYLFSGTALNVKPVDRTGDYLGNDRELKAFFGSNVEQSYNITGKELFFGQESNVHKKITTNIVLDNQTKLHPDIMLTGASGDDAFATPITAGDSIRDLVGDNDADETNDPNTIFYLRGRRSDGAAFKEKIPLSSFAKVQDLLDRIGIAFGNSQVAQVVDVQINKGGQIEIRDNRRGVSLLDFHMVSSRTNVDNIDELSRNGADVKEYTRSDFNALKNSKEITAVNNAFDNRMFEFPTTLLYSSGRLADGSTKLTDVLTTDIKTITLTGVTTKGEHIPLTETTPRNVLLDEVENKFGTQIRLDLERNPNTTVQDILALFSDEDKQKNISLQIGPDTTVDDLLFTIRDNFGEVDVNIKDGKIVMFDKDVGKLGTSNMQVKMTADTNAFSSDMGTVFDKAYWKKEGARLSTNVKQVTKLENEIATKDTKLVEVAGKTSLDGTNLVLDGKDINGTKVEYKILLSNQGSKFEVAGQQYDILGADGQATKADEVTYKQLFDVMSMALSTNLPQGAGVEAYENALAASTGDIDIWLKTNGEIVLRDNTTSETKMEFSLFDENASMFSANRSSGSALMFQANNAVTVDDPHNDFFTALDEAIESVANNRNRANGELKDPRNMGMQNTLTLIDNLITHVTNEHTKNGAQTNTLLDSVDRSSALAVNAKALRSEALDTDYAESALRLQQLNNNYQAMMATTSKIKDLSLVNYIR